MLKSITNAIGPRVGGLMLTTRKHSPELAVGVGLIAMVAGGILLARAHKRSDYLRRGLEDELTDIDEFIEYEEQENGVVLSAKQTVMVKGPAYLRYGVEWAKLYGPSIAVTGIGVGLIIGAHRIQNKRIQGLAAALMVVQQAFDNYRKRVVAELGVEADERYLWGLAKKEVTRVVEGEEGKKKKVKEEENTISEELSPTMYNRIFDSSNPMWKPDVQITEAILTGIQSGFQDKLDILGYVFLNDVYKALGFPETKYGQVVGWSRATNGDGYIDFGLDRAAFQNDKGDHKWLLTFNVDGDVLDFMGQ